MKVTIPKKTGERPNGFSNAPISLERPTVAEVTKDSYLKMKLRSTPTDADSPTYELEICYFKSGTPEEWLKFKKNLNRVIIGQNLTTGPTQYAMARRLLLGNCLAVFNNKAEELQNETVSNFKLCLKAVAKDVFPPKALMTQKRYMRRVLRKPKEMKIREYFTRYRELNNYLEEFPPFKDGQKLPEDELMEHAEFAIPNAWQKQMVLQGFNPVEHSLQEFIEFCERLEVSEDIYDGAHTKGQKTKFQKESSSNSNPQKETGKPFNKKRKHTNYFCLYHGNNTSHNTDDCKILKAQAERMAAAHKNAGKNTWSREKANKEKEENDKKKKAFQSYVTEIVVQANKKLKQDHNEAGASSFNLDSFNYEEFCDLPVSDDSDMATANNESSDA